MLSAPFILRSLEVTLYPFRWIKPRIEHCADGTTVVYFGKGRVCWR